MHFALNGPVRAHLSSLNVRLEEVIALRQAEGDDPPLTSPGHICATKRVVLVYSFRNVCTLHSESTVRHSAAVPLH